MDGGGLDTIQGATSPTVFFRNLELLYQSKHMVHKDSPQILQSHLQDLLGMELQILRGAVVMSHFELEVLKRVEETANMQLWVTPLARIWVRAGEHQTACVNEEDQMMQPSFLRVEP
jgi:hypothetical protein